MMSRQRFSDVIRASTVVRHCAITVAITASVADYLAHLLS
jgi:hypothetical protein